VGFEGSFEAGKNSERMVLCLSLVNAVFQIADLQKPVQDAVGLNGGSGLPYS
jgi:hypothetical protein